MWKTLKIGDFRAFLLHRFTRKKSQRMPAFLMNLSGLNLG